MKGILTKVKFVRSKRFVSTATACQGTCQGCVCRIRTHPCWLEADTSPRNVSAYPVLFFTPRNFSVTKWRAPFVIWHGSFTWRSSNSSLSASHASISVQPHSSEVPLYLKRQLSTFSTFTIVGNCCVDRTLVYMHSRVYAVQNGRPSLDSRYSA